MILKVFIHNCLIDVYICYFPILYMQLGAAEGSTLALYDLDHYKKEKSSHPTVTPYLSRYNISKLYVYSNCIRRLPDLYMHACMLSCICIMHTMFSVGFTSYRLVERK